MCRGPEPTSTLICPWILNLPGAPSRTSLQILSPPYVIVKRCYKAWENETITKSGTNTSPWYSRDICGFEGPLPTGKLTTEEGLRKRRESPGSVVMKAQFGEPNYKLIKKLNYKLYEKRTFIAVTSSVARGFVKVGPFPPVETESTRLSPPSESTTND